MSQRPLSRRRLLAALGAASAGGLVLEGIGPGRLTAEQQVHMQAAKDALQSALGHLEQATPDKGGHRVAAMKATRQAIDHVEKGIRFDRRT